MRFGRGLTLGLHQINDAVLSGVVIIVTKDTSGNAVGDHGDVVGLHGPRVRDKSRALIQVRNTWEGWVVPVAELLT